MRYIVLAGRVLFALIFIFAAPRHFSHEGIQHAADLGTPVAGVLVPLSGVMVEVLVQRVASLLRK